MSSVDRRGAITLGALGVLGLSGCTGRPSAPVSAPQATRARVLRSASPTPTPTFDTKQHSSTDPNSLWIVVNKQRPLPRHFAPTVEQVPVPHTNLPLLRRSARAGVIAMFAAAKRDGLTLASNSTYRSYDDQRSVYDTDKASLGRTAADKLTAHPGCSEHQTGLAIDIGPLSGKCSLQACMGSRPEGEWLAEHAWEHGFLLRYPPTAVAITGYQYEPWHFRFLGQALATELHHTGIQTLEEFFGLPPAPDYT